MLHPHLAEDDTYLERFQREASLFASIDHPNVIRIFEVGRDGDTHLTLMEYLPESLARVLENGGLSIEHCVDFALQIARGLDAAHELGVVHRDIKPQNVLLTPEGTVKLTDFGIARAETLTTTTATGMMVGTPHYMSPEQVRGQRADVRSDVYSLDVMLHQMLTGRVRFDADTPLAVLEMHREATPPRVRDGRPDVPRAIEAIVDRCLEKDPEQRFQTSRLHPDDSGLTPSAGVGLTARCRCPRTTR